MTRFRTGTLGQLHVPGHIDAPNPKLPGAQPATFPEAAPAPDVAFEGPDGKPVKIADFKGKVTLVNLWATWCAPCKVEMPTLAAVQAAYAGKDVAIVPISTDTAEDVEAAKAQIAANAPLNYYHSEGLDLPFAFQPAASNFPTTIIYDKQGVERGRLEGEADWNSPEAHKMIDALLAEG